jgi:ribosomal protein S27E
MATNMIRVEDSVDENGYHVSGYTQWECDKCGDLIFRYRGQSDVDCHNCGACYNASGQRLRDDWRGNPSVYDDNIGDMEGYEMQHANDQ